MCIFTPKLHCTEVGLCIFTPKLHCTEVGLCISDPKLHCTEVGLCISTPKLHCTEVVNVLLVCVLPMFVWLHCFFASFQPINW